MASWTPERSSFLTLLLDEVVGTEEMVKIRKENCRIYDMIYSCIEKENRYFTGSKAEGLDLPGSDYDYMYDINDSNNIRVIQTMQDAFGSPIENILYLCTDNVPVGFAMLRYNTHFRNLKLLRTSQYINGVLYFSSSQYVRYMFSALKSKTSKETFAIQGPSVEHWSEYYDTSKSGDDRVFSIHCPLWPSGAEEWVNRARQCGWPTSRDIESITSFGYHLVPIGHSLSPLKDIEWRISFSWAERTLVWSFNHVQMQLYATMKIILKEFINVKISPESRVLCSYFIKTFLFWKFETKEETFWCAENFRECLKFLLIEFSKCIREGVIRHYFFPRFNLLSIKLTREAQTELLRLLEVIIQYDIRIFKECKTLSNVWSHLIQFEGSMNAIKMKTAKINVLRNDECMMYAIMNHGFQIAISIHVLGIRQSTVPEIIEKILTRLQTMDTSSISVRHMCYLLHIKFRPNRCSGNRDLYKMHKIAHNKIQFDISTIKLWYAMILAKKGDYSSCLRIVNAVLSSIPPFALYMYNGYRKSNCESKSLYQEKFFYSNTSTIERARTAWLFDLIVMTEMFENVPLAIQVELRFCDDMTGVFLSPFVCAYYLMFLCYHEIHHYDDRDHALRMLIDTVKNPEQFGVPFHSLNIVGHCLLLAGQRSLAREVFLFSYQLTLKFPPLCKYNSSLHYLRNIPW